MNEQSIKASGQTYTSYTWEQLAEEARELKREYIHDAQENGFTEQQAKFLARYQRFSNIDIPQSELEV